MQKRFIAIDPSSKVLNVFYNAYGAYVSVQVPTEPENMDAFFYSLRLLRFTHVVYEDCYLHRNTKVYGMLAALRERVRESARKVGLKFELVSASEWQNALLIRKGEKKTDTKRKERKERSVKLAEHIIGYPPASDDIADSVCLWYYASEESPTKFEQL